MPAFTYKGDGSEFLEGVPAKDLTADMFDMLDADLQANVRANPLYEEVPEKSSRKAQTPAAVEETPV